MATYSVVAKNSNDSESFEEIVEKNRFDNHLIGEECQKSCCVMIGRRIMKFCHNCCGVNIVEESQHRKILLKKYALGFFEVIIAFNYIYWFSTLIHNKFCNFLFKCSCTWEWKGGWKDCNVHSKVGPKCPWCSARSNISWTTDYLITSLMLIGYLYLLSNRKKWFGHPLFRIFIPILIYFSTGTIVGMFFLAKGYPYFIF
jgi:hypothetical protein